LDAELTTWPERRFSNFEDGSDPVSLVGGTASS
jgi:hypothetical protein